MHKLTNRQKAILNMLVGGFTQKEIGRELSMNYNTLAHHVREARLKCAANTTEQLVVLYALAFRGKEEPCVYTN